MHDADSFSSEARRRFPLSALLPLLFCPLAVAILGCAQAPVAAGKAAAQQPASAEVAATPPDADGAKNQAASPAPADPLPNVDLTSSLLFEILAAEVAQQRGDAGAAFATMMKAARDTSDYRLARRAAEIALAARATAQALEASQLWHELAPHNAEAEQTLSALLIASGRFDDAQPLLAGEIREATVPTEELGRVQRLLARAPDRARAMALLDQLAKPYLADPATAFDARLVVANGAHASGDIDRSIAEADAALKLKPDSERAAMTAAQFRLRSDGGENAAGRTEALSILDRFLHAHPQARDARTMYARLLVADGKIDAARAQFELLLSADESQPDTLYALGLLALQADQRVEARRYLERYVEVAQREGAERDPDPAYLALARLSIDEEKYNEALRWLDRIEGSEQALNARLERAHVLARMNRIDDALRILTDPPPVNDDERVKLILAHGQVLRDAHRYQEWYDLLDHALAQSPDDAELLYETGMAAERIDRIDAMETHLRRLMQLHPDYAHAYNALGYSLADRNLRLPEALDLITEALKLAPDDGFIIDSLGWVQFRMGELSQARDTLQRAYQLKPEADVAAHLGEVLWALGDKDSARKVWREGNRKEGDNETLKATLMRLKVRL